VNTSIRIALLVLPFFLSSCGMLSNNSENASQSRQACIQDGVRYESGAAVPSNDACNSCGCSDGNVLCTEMACN